MGLVEVCIRLARRKKIDRYLFFGRIKEELFVYYKKNRARLGFFIVYI